MVVGIGCDGWRGLTGRARTELLSADVIFGSARQIGSLPSLAADTHAWRSPMSQHLVDIVTAPPCRTVHVLASGDPMFHGVGSTLVDMVGVRRVRVLPTVSSASLAAARLGWDLARSRVVSLVGAPVGTLVPELSCGVRLLVLSRDGSTPAQIAQLLQRQGFGSSMMHVLEQLGGDAESIAVGLADTMTAVVCNPLNIVAIECAGPARSAQPGRADREYLHDGQLTKQTIRAVTVCALRPSPNQLLWDVGAGSGSISIEWLRAESTVRAVAFERDPIRVARIRENAERHGVADRLSLGGLVPDSLSESVEPPDAVFVGGGVSASGVLEGCWNALSPGGLIVVNAVTVESEIVLTHWQRQHGGDLSRIRVENLEELASMTAWRSALPVTQWRAIK
ncbi:precorrin-6y C5,15-methyltransferase (decarboxylating) subunit CbiE [Mycolicibacterium neoaurum]|uniref:precorrin-6y C5,15-methyltransferase (decarboxylating) subunit CbiE n=1 Tax=Mycolicibacterium neoaurum TaxID=1795 RepID=UPI003014AD77